MAYRNPSLSNHGQSSFMRGERLLRVSRHTKIDGSSTTGRGLTDYPDILRYISEKKNIYNVYRVVDP